MDPEHPEHPEHPEQPEQTAAAAHAVSARDSTIATRKTKHGTDARKLWKLGVAPAFQTCLVVSKAQNALAFVRSACAVEERGPLAQPTRVALNRGGCGPRGQVAVSTPAGDMLAFVRLFLVSAAQAKRASERIVQHHNLTNIYGGVLGMSGEAGRVSSSRQMQQDRGSSLLWDQMMDGAWAAATTWVRGGILALLHQLAGGKTADAAVREQLRRRAAFLTAVWRHVVWSPTGLAGLPDDGADVQLTFMDVALHMAYMLVGGWMHGVEGPDRTLAALLPSVRGRAAALGISERHMTNVDKFFGTYLSTTMLREQELTARLYKECVYDPPARSRA